MSNKPLKPENSTLEVEFLEEKSITGVNVHDAYDAIENSLVSNESIEEYQIDAIVSRPLRGGFVMRMVRSMKVGGKVNVAKPANRAYGELLKAYLGEPEELTKEYVVYTKTV
jgi:hypothetical protein